MTQQKIMQVLDNNPELMKVLMQYRELSPSQKELCFDDLIDTMQGKRREMTAAEKEDAFIDMLHNPLFWFDRWLDKMHEEPERMIKEADELRGGFRQRYTDLPEGSALENSYIAFAAGLDAGIDILKGIIEV